MNVRRQTGLPVTILLLCALLAGCAVPTLPMPTPMAEAPSTTAPPSPTAQPTATASPAPSATATPLPSPAPTRTPAPTGGPTPVPTATPTPRAGTSKNGKVILAFADSKEGAYAVAFPLMQQYGVSGLAYVNIEPIVAGQPGRLTVKQLDEMNAAGWDIASHGYSHSDPTQMTAAELAQDLEGAHRWLLDHGYVKGARHYGPPSNNCNQLIVDTAVRTYQTVWCREFSKLPPGYRYGTGACGNNTTWERLQSAFDKLVGQPDRVLRCTFHGLVMANPKSNEADQERVKAILEYLKAKDIPVVTLSDLLDGRVP